jgi:glutaredoxin-related protein
MENMKSEKVEQYIMYGRDSCPYCIKMKEQLKKDGVFYKFKFVDVSTSKGSRLFSMTNADGVPFFINPVNNKHAVGAMPTKELLMTLGTTNPRDGFFKNVYMFGTKKCGYTVKMVQELKRAGVWDDITYIDIYTKEGSKLFEKTNTTGIPLFLHKNGKMTQGYAHVEEIIKNLE